MYQCHCSIAAAVLAI